MGTKKDKKSKSTLKKKLSANDEAVSDPIQTLWFLLVFTGMAIAAVAQYRSAPAIDEVLQSNTGAAELKIKEDSPMISKSKPLPPTSSISSTLRKTFN